MNLLWTSLAARADLQLTDEQDQALGRYLDLLTAGNATMNLTRIVDRAAAEVQHIGDALTLLPYLPRGAFGLADVGSGGGVPGIPLAIVRPDAQVVLVESTRKKAAFLQETAAAMGLGNVTVRAERAEELGRSAKFRETFDVAAARAVGTLDWLAEWCLPLVKTGGVMLAMKGPRGIAEMETAQEVIRRLGGGRPVAHAAELAEDRHHLIVEIPKRQNTPRAYPRPTSATGGKSPGQQRI